MVIITHDPTAKAEAGQNLQTKPAKSKTTITAFPKVMESIWQYSTGEVTSGNRSKLKTDIPSTAEKTAGEILYEAKQSLAAKSAAPGYTQTISAKSMSSTDYEDIIERAACTYGVEASLIKAMIKMESDFKADEVSSSGAMGLMQLMPETAKSLGVTDAFDPEQNIMGGTKYIAQKLKDYDGNLELALSAYNAGSGTVKRYGGVPPQCKLYISKIKSYKEAYETAKNVD